MRLLERYTILLLGLLFYVSSSFSKNTTQVGTNPVPPSQSIHFTPAWPHGDISEVFADVFFVTGTNKIHHEGVDIQTSRNMLILRNGSELTLVNTVRLNEDGLKKLESLGSVTHIVRIGAFHGRDDAFYRNHYPTAQLWTLKGMTYENGLKPDQDLMPNGKMPLPGCSIFVFETSTQPEGILHIDRDGGILISCDSIQNRGGPYNSDRELSSRFCRESRMHISRMLKFNTQDSSMKLFQSKSQRAAQPSGIFL